MKRALCIVLALAMLLSLGGCGGELPHFVREVDDLDNFHCHVYLLPDDEALTLHGDDAKAAYRLVTESLRNAEETTDGPGDEQIDMVFYTGDVNPLDDTVEFEKQYGCYAVGAIGVVMYVASVSASFSHHFQVDPSVYTALLKMM